MQKEGTREHIDDTARDDEEKIPFQIICTGRWHGENRSVIVNENVFVDFDSRDSMSFAQIKYLRYDLSHTSGACAFPHKWLMCFKQ